MNCHEVHERLRNDQPTGTEQHLAECPACAELAKDSALIRALSSEPPASETGPGGLDVAALWSSTEDSVRREATGWRRVANWSTPNRLAALAGAIALLFVAVFLFKRRADWVVYPASRLALEFGVLGLAGATAGWLALRPVHVRYWSRGREWLLAAVAVAITFGIASLPAAHHAHPASSGGTGDDLLPRALSCFGWGSAVALAVCAVFLLLARGRHRVRDLPPAVWGAAAIVASLALTLHCPLVTPLHLQLGHASVGIALVALAAWLTRRRARN